MKSYDTRCVYCGNLNRALLLEETGGWMECERCKRSIHLCKGTELTLIPFFDPNREAWLTRHVS